MKDPITVSKKEYIRLKKQKKELEESQAYVAVCWNLIKSKEKKIERLESLSLWGFFKYKYLNKANKN